MLKKIIENVLWWLYEKVNNGECTNCPCAHYECNYLDGDYSEWCDLGNIEELHWFCVMPYRIKELLIKRVERRLEKYIEKRLKEESEGANG